MGLISEKRVRIWEGDRGDEGAVTAGKGELEGWSEERVQEGKEQKKKTGRGCSAKRGLAAAALGL